MLWNWNWLTDISTRGGYSMFMLNCSIHYCPPLASYLSAVIEENIGCSSPIKYILATFDGRLCKTQFMVDAFICIWKLILCELYSNYFEKIRRCGDWWGWLVASPSYLSTDWFHHREQKKFSVLRPVIDQSAVKTQDITRDRMLSPGGGDAAVLGCVTTFLFPLSRIYNIYNIYNIYIHKSHVTLPQQTWDCKKPLRSLILRRFISGGWHLESFDQKYLIETARHRPGPRHQARVLIMV